VPFSLVRHPLVRKVPPARQEVNRGGRLAKQHEKKRGSIVPIFNPPKPHPSSLIGVSWQDDKEREVQPSGILRRFHFSRISSRWSRGAWIGVDQAIFRDIVRIMPPGVEQPDSDAVDRELAGFAFINPDSLAPP
jgi:hypothetical protein